MIKDDSLTIQKVSKYFNVSVDSVRNWIKTGDLEQTTKGSVSIKSFEMFKCGVAGKNKLVSRANKSLKDSHDHQAVQQHYISLLTADVDNEILGNKYENDLSDSYRNKEGVYYTPEYVITSMFRYIPICYEFFTFCDPCCGSGNFVISAIKQGIPPESVYGYDVDEFAVELTKQRIYDLCGYRSENIKCLNFLDESLNGNIPKFDIIFTNPPWGKKMTRKEKDMYGKAFATGKSVDTSSLFFFACLRHLNDDGFLGFLLQDAFFNIKTYESARIKALSLTIKSVIDFDKPFEDLMTKVKGLIIQNTKCDNTNRVMCENINYAHNRTQESFNKNIKHIINPNITQTQSDKISHLYKLDHITLKNKATWGMGIVTGNNEKFVSDENGVGLVPIYRGKDITNDGLNESGLYTTSDLSVYQQVAPEELYKANEKLIYKFISSKLVFFHDTKQRYILNSANFVIPNGDFQISQTQLRDLLNSKIMNWLFTSIFDTCKVLRTDIEELPLHIGYFKEYDTFSDENFMNYLGIGD